MIISLDKDFALQDYPTIIYGFNLLKRHSGNAKSHFWFWSFSLCWFAPLTSKVSGGK